MGMDEKKTRAVERQQAEIRTYLLPITYGNSAETFFVLLSQNQVVEVLGKRAIGQVPCAPSYVKGVISYQDALVPVVALEPLCGAPFHQAGGQVQQLVIVRTGAVDAETGASLKVAVIADRRLRMARFSAKMLAAGFTAQQAPAALESSGILKGYFSRQNNNIAVVDFHDLVTGLYHASGAKPSPQAD